MAASLLIGATAFAQQDTAKKEFKPSGKVWGYAFGDYYYKVHADSLNRGANQYSNMKANANAFEFRRVYLGYDYNISERFSTELLLAYEGNTLGDGSRTVYIKSANLRWKNIYKGGDLIFGQQATPAFPLVAEKLWGYRSIEKTILDMRKGSSSNDLGIGLQAKIGEKGNFGYDLLVGNGTAQKLETDIFKKFYGDFYAKLLNQKLVFDIYADYERTLQLPDFHKYKSNIKLDAIYTSDPVTVGVEAYITTLHNYVGFLNLNPTPPSYDTTDAMVMGISVFTHGTIIKEKLSFFARYDMYNPDTKFNADYTYTMGGSPVTESFITAGIDYTPHKNVHIMPNIWYDGYMNRTKGATGLAKSDYDLVPRLTTWYVFK
jgi:hypothetical protein